MNAHNDKKPMMDRQKGDLTLHYVHKEHEAIGMRDKGYNNKQAIASYLSPKALFWIKFKRHKMGLISFYFLVFCYISLLFVPFLAPFNMQHKFRELSNLPAHSIHFFHKGEFYGPFIYAYIKKFNPETFRLDVMEDKTKPIKLGLFTRGDDYRLLGMFPTNIHLFGTANNEPFFLLGSDVYGRDMVSAILYGARTSLTIGLIGVGLSVFLGVLIGGVAGYFGGGIDWVIQRTIEIMRSLPELPIWMALAAVIPIEWPPLSIFFGLTIIFGLLDWPGLARTVRSKFMSLKREDYVTAAHLYGAKPMRIIFGHLLPNFSSHLIASVSLAIPSMILGETALSYLGLGLREPMLSWGVLLNNAQDISAIVLYPWLLWPVIPVIIVVLAFNFVGDALRDAADPFK